MDSLSQIVLGAAVSNAVLGKKIGNKSIIYGAIIGTLPDLDVWIAKFFYDPITQIEVHRGLSHAILFYLVISFIIGFLIYKIEKKQFVTYKESFLTSFLILLTHSLLDAFTTWGTQILWPFYGKIAIKSIFVIDPLYTIPFLCCLFFSITKAKNNPKRYFWNNTGLLISSSYLIFSVFLKFIVYNKVDTFLVDKNIEYSNLVVKPTAMNTILWNIIVETEDHFLISDYSFFDSNDIKFVKHAKNHNLIKEIKDEPIMQQLTRISENQFIITNHNNILQFHDLRFGLLSDTKDDVKYAFSYILYQEGDQWKAKEVVKNQRDGMQLLKKIGLRLKGN